MKSTLQIMLFVGLMASVSLSSCVSKKKFMASEGKANKLRNDSLQAHKRLDDCNNQMKDCSAKVKSLTLERDAWHSQNTASQNDLQNLSSKSKMTIADQAKRLQDLQNMFQAQRNATDKLKKTIADALQNFNADELFVYVKDDKVYVSLQEKLLFKSGSSVVDPKGKEALGSLAKVLNTTPDINVLIEGHTDTIPIKRTDFADNWALSVGRATSIVRILTKDYGVDAHSVTASGRGEFHPLKPNSTEQGRASNRRTEIIISPNLSELFKLLDY